jgi:hypothetical protein
VKTSNVRAQKYMSLRPPVPERIINTINYMRENGGQPVYVTVSDDLWNKMTEEMPTKPSEIFVETENDKIPVTPDSKLSSMTIHVHGPENRG